MRTPGQPYTPGMRFMPGAPQVDQAVVAQPVVAQPVQPVAVPVQPVAVVEAAPLDPAEDFILATPLAGTIMAEPATLAVPPVAVLENAGGTSPYKVINPGVVLGIRNSGRGHFISSLNGVNTAFRIDN